MTALEELIEYMELKINEMSYAPMNLQGIHATNEIIFQAKQLLTKEKQEREELIKEVCIKSALDNFYAGQDLAHGYKVDWNSAEQYYEEVIKKQL